MQELNLLLIHNFLYQDYYGEINLRENIYLMLIKLFMMDILGIGAVILVSQNIT